MTKERVQMAVSVLVFPVIMGGGVLLCVRLLDDMAVASAVMLANIIAALLIIGLERITPHHRPWNETQGDVRTDAMHGVVSMLLLPEVVRTLTYGGLVALSGWLTSSVGGSLWPSAWGLVPQLILALAVGEFGTYWTHRLMHESPLFWRIHAVHHSAPRLYWLNAGRFHPLDSLFGYIVAVPPLIALGCPEAVIGLFLLVTGIHGMFQHANIRLRLGPLNWVFSMAELHRWHHSRTIEESNSNYGANLIIWDILFGTRFLPTDREPPPDIGIHDIPEFPRGYLEQLASPFRYDEILAQQPGDGTS